MPDQLSPQPTSSLWTKIKEVLAGLAGLAAVIAGWFIFFRKENPTDMPVRPSRYPGGEDKPEIPKPLPFTDYNKRVTDDAKAAKKDTDRLSDDDQKLADELNKKYQR